MVSGTFGSSSSPDEESTPVVVPVAPSVVEQAPTTGSVETPVAPKKKSVLDKLEDEAKKLGHEVEEVVEKIVHKLDPRLTGGEQGR